MAKTRMLKNDRQIITDAIVDHKFKPLLAANQAQEYALADEVYKSVYQEYLPVMDQLPKGAFPGKTYLSCNAGGLRITLYFSADAAFNPAEPHVYRPEKREVRLVFEKYEHDYVPLTGDLRDRVSAWATEGKTLKEDRQKSYQRVFAALEKFYTFDDAIEAWPEASKFLDAQLTKRGVMVRPGLPAVLLIDLNREMGLPPGDEA